MALIEGIGDDVITILFLVFLLVIVIMSWLSTNVRDLPRPNNFYFIERNTGRLFTANSLDGNLHVLSPLTRQTNRPARWNNMSQVEVPSFSSSSETETTSRTTTARTSTITTTTTTTTTDMDMVVDELVEQALVDNLLDGNIYAASSSSPSAVANSLLDATVVNNNSQETIGEPHPHSSETSLLLSSVAADNATTTAGVSSGNGRVDTTMLGCDPTPLSCPEDFINIFVRFVNEREIKLRVKPDDTISFLKRTHFSQELSSNKIVRFIYQGQFLSETATIKSYNIKDQTTIHCHITCKQSSSSSPTSAFDENLPRSIRAVPDMISSTSSSSISTYETASLASVSRRRSDTAAAAAATLAVATSMSVQQQQIHQQQQQQQQQQQPLEPVLDMIAFLLNHCILPLFAGLLTGCWYFRINFKHLFSPLTTLILVVFTFLYALFLLIYIHSTSAYALNSFFMRTSSVAIRPLQRHNHHHHHQHNNN